MQVWYTSDTHFGHKFIAGKRGFTSADEHDAELARRWNKRVRPEDTVWVLGDVALGNRSESLKVFSLLNGTKHLVWGNHDNGFARHANAWKQHPLYLQYFSTVQSYAEHRFGSYRVLLSHFPYRADHTGTGPSYSQYRLPDEGMYLIHGHLHSTEKITSDHEIHVGTDAWGFYPAPQHKVLELIRELERKKGEQADAPAREQGSPE